MKFFLRCWRMKETCRTVIKEKPSSICSQVGKRKRTVYSSQSNGLGNKLKERRHSKVLGLGSCQGVV